MRKRKFICRGLIAKPAKKTGMSVMLNLNQKYACEVQGAHYHILNGGGGGGRDPLVTPLQQIRQLIK